MAQKLISLEATNEDRQQKEIDLSPVVPPRLSQEVTDERALRYHYTMGEKSPGPEVLRTQINGLHENLIREQIALDRTIEEQEVRLGVLNTYMQARDTGKPLTKEDVSFVQQLMKPQPVSPESIVERQYAEKVIDQVTTLDDNPDMADSYDSDPDFTMDAITVAQEMVSKTLLARKVFEDLEAMWKERGTGVKVADWASVMLIPGLDWYRQTNLTKESSSFWLGGNKEDQIQYLYSLPLEQFHGKLKEAMSYLWEANPLIAFEFLDSVLHYSTTDASWDTAFNAIDIASVLPVATVTKATKGTLFLKVLKKKAKELGVSEDVLRESITRRDKVKTQLKDIGKASADNKNLPEEILAASGRVEDAADMAADRILRENVSGKDPRGLFDDLAKRTVSLLDPERRLGIDKARLADTQTMRLLETMKGNQELAMDAFGKLPRVQRQTLEAENAGLDAAREALKMRYPHLDDSIMYWNAIRATDQTVTNNATMEMVIGRPDAGLFISPEEARTWARDWYQLPPGGYEVRQNGVGYGIHIAKDVDETDVRSFLVTTENTAPTNRFASYWLNKAFLKAGSKEKVSLAQREDRALLTAASEKLTQVAKQMTDDVGSLTRTEAQSLNKVLDYNRSMIDPETGKIGKFYDDLNEFQTEFNKIMQRAPTLREMQGYFTIVQLNDLEYILTTLPLHSHKTRQGMEILRFKFMGDQMAEPVVSKFEGRLSKEIPWDDGNIGGILEVSEDARSYRYFRKERVSIDEKAELDDLVATKGYKVIQVANPDQHLFGKLGIPENRPVSHVLVKQYDARPLRLTDHIPYKPGTHADYVDEWWTKEPKMLAKDAEDGGGNIYKGDRTVFNHASETKAKKFTDALDRAKYLFRSNLIKEFDDHVTKNLPFRPRELEDMFTGKTLENGTFVDPRYDFNAPTLTLRSSQRSVDQFSSLMNEKYGVYEDLINTPYNMYKDLDKRHTGQRNPNAWTVENRGTPQNPDFQLDEAKFIDPLKSTYQSLARTIRSQHYEDYQIKSVESFIEQFSDILLDAPGGRPGNKKKLYANIRDVLANPIWMHGADPQKLESAKHMRDAVNQLLGVQSQTAHLMDSYMQRLANYAFSSGAGDRKLFGSKIEEWIPNHKMQYVKDPFKWMRAMAYQTKLAFGNPVTWFVQMQGVVPLMSIAGSQKAFKGGFGAHLHMMSSHTSVKGVYDHIAKTAEGMGWKADEWKDASELLRRSGFDIIGGSHAYLDDMANPKLFRGKFGRALDAGGWFFRNSEGFIKTTSFFTAYDEALARGTIKAGKVTDRQLGSILSRAETLALNMTRNNNASYQQGIGSTMTQFWSYQMRTFELLWGRQLSGPEKRRLFAGTAAVYGLPVGLSAAATPMWPLQESIRQAALERGDNPDEGLLGVILHGAPQLALSMVTGEHYNIAERWGPGGNESIKTAFEGDFHQALLDLGMGASGSILGDIISDLVPAVKHAMYLTDVDNETYGKILANDLIKAARNISSVNNLMTLTTAMQTGQLISRNDTILGELDTVDAVLRSITGLTPTHIQDTFLKQQSIQSRRDEINSLYSAMLPSMKALMRARKAGDREAMERASVSLKAHISVSGLRHDEKIDIISRLYRENMDMQGGTALNFLEKGDIAPENQEAVREQTRQLFKRLEE